MFDTVISVQILFTGMCETLQGEHVKFSNVVIAEGVASSNAEINTIKSDAETASRNGLTVNSIEVRNCEGAYTVNIE